jgi:hypothetical protein
MMDWLGGLRLKQVGGIKFFDEKFARDVGFERR